MTWRFSVYLLVDLPVADVHYGATTIFGHGMLTITFFSQPDLGNEVRPRNVVSHVANHDNHRGDNEQTTFMYIHHDPAIELALHNQDSIIKTT